MQLGIWIIKTPPLCTIVSIKSVEYLNHRATKVGERALGLAGVWTGLEHAQIDKPCSGIEFGVDSLDSEVPLVA